MPNRRTLSNWPLAGYPVHVWDEDGNERDGDNQCVVLVDSTGAAITLPGSTVTTATESSTTVTNSSGVKVAANTSRKGGFLQNLSTSEVLFYSFSGTATTSDFKLGPYQILPFHIDGLLYKGAISMIADDAGPYNIKVVECT